MSIPLPYLISLHSSRPGGKLSLHNNRSHRSAAKYILAHTMVPTQPISSDQQVFCRQASSEQAEAENIIAAAKVHRSATTLRLVHSIDLATIQSNLHFRQFLNISIIAEIVHHHPENKIPCCGIISEHLYQPPKHSEPPTDSVPTQHILAQVFLCITTSETSKSDID